METHFRIISLLIHYIRAARRHRRGTQIAPVCITPKGVRPEKEDFLHCFRKRTWHFVLREQKSLLLDVRESP